MAKKAKTKTKTPANADKAKPKVHGDIKDMDIRINEFGEIVRDYKVDEINAFLNEKVKDKKLSGDE
ncbi:MAG: hypothetical protein JNL02_14575 [Saprospiraceae bacterium]|nr:hypothetical protein [Saprospiraceae bacterium]